MAIKSIGKAVKSPLFKTISNTIKKPIIKSIRSTIKNSMRVFDYNKNTIKNLASGLEGKYLRTRHNFGSRPIKYLGEEGIKKFKYIAP